MKMKAYITATSEIQQELVLVQRKKEGRRKKGKEKSKDKKEKEMRNRIKKI